MAIQPRLTVEEFEKVLALPENAERLLELINGEIVEKVPTEKHGELALAFGSAIRAHVVRHKLGRVGVEIRHQLPSDKRNSRLPDISFISGKRASVEQGSVRQMPDLAVEIKSPDDSLDTLKDKAHYYLLNGTLLVWILDWTKKQVWVKTPDDEYVLNEADTLDGGDVLPGFKILISDIFADSMAE